jgi:hypothetical protein
MEEQVPVFVYLKNRVAQLYPPAMGSLYVASYDSQGYDEGILTRLHTVRGRVTLRLIVCPLCGRLTRYCFVSKSLGPEFVVLSLWGALSDERPFLSFVSHSLVLSREVGSVS